MTDEQLAPVLAQLWLAALAGASGFEQRSRAVMESAAARLATLHGGSLLDWQPPPPRPAEVVAQPDAKR